MSIDFSEYITVFTDASFCHKTRSTGYAIWIKHGKEGTTERIVGNSSIPKNSTLAERLGLNKAIEYVHRFIDHENKRLVIQCDSKVALYSIKVPFADSLKSLKLKHVKAHQNGIDARSWVNEWCDTAAREQMLILRKEKKQQMYRDRFDYYNPHLKGAPLDESGELDVEPLTCDLY